METDNRLLLLDEQDNVFVVCAALAGGEDLIVEGDRVEVREDISLGHKVARVTLPVNSKIYKYGAPIGSTTVEVKRGQWLHTHNMRSDYIPTYGRDVGDKPMDGH